jgi:Sister chromatid cohesion C-terminus
MLVHISDLNWCAPLSIACALLSSYVDVVNVVWTLSMLLLILLFQGLVAPDDTLPHLMALQCDADAAVRSEAMRQVRSCRCGRVL